MPFIEGSSKRIRQDPATGFWHCIHCDFKSPRYQPVVGHLGMHRVEGQPVGRPRKTKDPLDMSFTQLADEIENLRKKNTTLQAALLKEQRRNRSFRSAMSTFLQDHGAE